MPTPNALKLDLPKQCKLAARVGHDDLRLPTDTRPFVHHQQHAPGHATTSFIWLDTPGPKTRISLWFVPIGVEYNAMPDSTVIGPCGDAYEGTLGLLLVQWHRQPAGITAALDPGVARDPALEGTMTPGVPHRDGSRVELG